MGSSAAKFEPLVITNELGCISRWSGILRTVIQVSIGIGEICLLRSRRTPDSARPISPDRQPPASCMTSKIRGSTEMF